MTTCAIDEDTAVAKAREKYHSISKRLKEIRERIRLMSDAVKAGEERLPELMAQEIMVGRVKDERCAALEAQLASQRDDRRRLHMEERALAIAGRESGKALQAAESHAEQQAAAALQEEIVAAVRELDASLTRSERLNDKLLVLDAKLRESGLAQVAGKRLMLLARAGSAWSALNPHHVGQTITLQGWRQHLRGILEE